MHDLSLSVLDTGFKYQPYVCNACHDFNMTVQNLSDLFIVTVKNAGEKRKVPKFVKRI